MSRVKKGGPVLGSPPKLPSLERPSLERKVHKYRLVIPNVSPDEDVVRRMMQEELGNVNLVDWYVEDSIHFEGLVSGAGMMPQRHTYVLLRYRD